jgi:hypothetical protein
LLVLFCLINYNKLPGFLANKTVMGATCVIVRGGFEGLGAPELDETHVTPNATARLNSSLSITALEEGRNSLSLSPTQMENQRQIENSKGSLSEVNPEGQAVPIPIQTGMSSSTRFMDFKYVMGLGNPCPWKISPSPPRETRFIPSCSADSESEPSDTGDHIITKVETINQKFELPSKSTNSEASPNLISHGHGQINNPSSNRDIHSLLKDLFKKFK